MRWLFFFVITALTPLTAISGSYPCVKNKDAKLMNSPEEKAKEIRKLSLLTPLEATGKTKRNWLEVKDYSGKVSWIHRKDVSYGKNCLILKARKARLRSGPGEEFSVNKSVKKGEAFVDLGDGEDGWLHVEDAAGEQSWVEIDHIWRPAGSRLRMSFEED